MVYYLSVSSDGVDRDDDVATKWGILDVPTKDVNKRLAYAEPDRVHPSAMQEHRNRREQGYWLDPETLPKKTLWGRGSTPALPDILPWFIVSPRFKDLVEQFEPGVHQFVPVDVYHAPEGDPVATYYWFIVGQRLDSVDREHTTYVWDPNGDELGYGRWLREIIDANTLEFIEVPNAKLVFSNRQVSGHHIWHDPHVLSFNNGLCSDDFAQAARAAGLTGLGVTPRETV